MIFPTAYKAAPNPPGVVRCNWRAVGWRTFAPLSAPSIRIRGLIDCVEQSLASRPVNNAPAVFSVVFGWGTLFRQTLNNAGGYVVKLCPFLHRVPSILSVTRTYRHSDERSREIGKETHELGKIIQGD